MRIHGGHSYKYEKERRKKRAKFSSDAQFEEFGKMESLKSKMLEEMELAQVFEYQYLKI
jgi:hypothetical protein